MIRRPLLLSVFLAVILIGVVTPVQSQPFVAQVQQAVTQMTNGIISFVTLGLNASSYINWGTARQASGYGVRDNAGTIQGKNSGGSWVNIVASGGAAPGDATYITQIPNATLTNEQALSALATGLTINTTGTGVLSAYGGTSCTNQFPRSLSVSGAATCASVAIGSDFSGLTAANRLPYATSDSALTTSSTFTFNGTSLGIGIAVPVSEWVTPIAQAHSAASQAELSMSTARTDADAVRIGSFSGDNQTNSATYKTATVIDFLTDGGTANKRGGRINFLTTANNSASGPQVHLTIDQAGHVFLPHVSTASAATAADACFQAAGEVVNDSALCIVSARRFKHDIVDSEVGLQFLTQLRPVSYYLNEALGDAQKRQQFGFIAEEVEAVDNRFVTYQPDGQIRSVLYIELIPVLTKAIQEQQAEIDALRARLP